MSTSTNYFNFLSYFELLFKRKTKDCNALLCATITCHFLSIQGLIYDGASSHQIDYGG